MIDLHLEFSKADLERIRAYPEGFKRAARQSLTIAMNEARNHVYETGFGGRPHLISRRGQGGLLGSIFYRTAEAGEKVIGIAGTAQVYARVHEEGATITAKRAKYLRFQVAGRWVMKRSVTIPARPYLRPAMEAAGKEFVRDFPPRVIAEVSK